jgi:cell division protein FtsI/penicillin-binding protein 2
MRAQYAWRSLALAGLLAFVGLSIILQMIRIQTSPEAETFRERVATHAVADTTYYPERGLIYDRNGHLLAGNKTVYEIDVELKNVKEPNALAKAVGTELGLNPDDLYNLMVKPPNNLPYIVIGHYVDEDKALALKQLTGQTDEQTPTSEQSSLSGLVFTPHPQRSYPEGALASNVIGFVSNDGHGYFGIEEKYNDLLAGTPIQVKVPVDPNKAADIPQIPNGTTLILTLNRDLQAATEQILDDSLTKYGAKSGTIVIMDPRNGEILAMASTPRMDLNQFLDYSAIYHNASEYNPAVSMPYEPGSVMKILTMAAALDNHTVTPATTFFDTGVYRIGGVTIRNWNGQAWGLQDMLGCIQNSLNVCMAWIASQMGSQNFYGYMNRFGIGHETGIDLADEAAGRLKVPGDTDWYPADLGTNAFGQGVAATPIQIMMAASAIANNSRMVIPHVLYAMVRDGRQFNVPAQYAGSPISTNTAQVLDQMLENSLQNEASLALIPNYKMAGKTGTAQIPVDGGYDPTLTNASFIGWGPVDDPRFMIYVWLEQPSTSIWGSETAAPVFAQAAQKAILLLDVPPDNIRSQVAMP